MKNIFILAGMILLLSLSALAAPTATIVCNSIDCAMNQGYFDNLASSGINITVIPVDDLPKHKEDPFIIILGGQNAPEGIGRLVSGLLNSREKNEIISTPDSKTTVVIYAPWVGKQKVLVYAGYGKEQTRKAFGDAQGDLMKSLRLNESVYPQNFTRKDVQIPPLDLQQPFTEVNAYEAYSIMQGIPNLEVIDVRGTAIYDMGHVPGAVNMPVRVIEQNLGALSKDKTYLIYCGGNSESIKAGTILSAAGYTKLYRLVDGYMAWRKAGYPKE
jgi:rhodanese-related sulfurtransferase